MPKNRNSTAPRETSSYVAAFPYFVKTRKKGRRTYESTLVHGTLRAEMPVVAAGEARPVFRVTHANGIRNDVLGWNGALWVAMRDHNGTPLSAERFADVLVGRDIERRMDNQTVRLFDPFSSSLNWKDGEPWNMALVNGHISNNPEAQKDPAAEIVSDGESVARARAARIAERLALIDGEVCLRVPGPMWQVAKPDEPRRRGERAAAELVIRPEWRLPMRCLDSHFRLQESVGDHRPGPVMKDGNFFAWDRKVEARTMAVRTDGTVVEEGLIEVIDLDLAHELTRPGADIAASAVHVLTPIVEETSKQLLHLSDRAVEDWTAMRLAARNLEEVWFGDAETARRGFRALDGLVEEFEESARNKHTSGSNAVSYCASAMRRWRELEKPRAMAPQDDEAVAAMRM